MSQTVRVLWLSRHPETILARGYADQGLWESILSREAWRSSDPITYEHHVIHGDDDWGSDGAVVILPARHHTSPDDVAWFLNRLNRLPWSLVILAGDEEWAFPWRSVEENEQRRVYTMQPIAEHSFLSGTIPGGWYPNTYELLLDHDSEASSRPLDWFFAGQITHIRRQQFLEAAQNVPGGRLEPTKGYLQEAVSRADYFRLMASAKVIPCPSGPMTVDTARAFEALEAGCVPLLDARKPLDPQFDYWTLLFGEDHGLPTIEDWADFPTILAEQLSLWPSNANRAFAFWQGYKRRLSHKLDLDVRAVSNTTPDSTNPNDLITVVVTTSPVQRHPSTDHLQLTLDSIRAQLPDAEIVLVFDGVRPEQEPWQPRYDEYTRRALWLTNFRYHNIVPIVLDKWGHQQNAMLEALKLISTPLILFVEHDTPLTGDIDWNGMCRVIRSGAASTIRLHFDDAIHPDQAAIMLDQETQRVDGVPLRRTVAWWQRPHLSLTAFYRETLMPMFPPASRTMIEDFLYERLWCDHEDYGEEGWNKWRVWIYAPEGSMKRSGHLDSREGHPKYGMKW